MVGNELLAFVIRKIKMPHAMKAGMVVTLATFQIVHAVRILR